MKRTASKWLVSALALTVCLASFGVADARRGPRARHRAQLQRQRVRQQQRQTQPNASFTQNLAGYIRNNNLESFTKNGKIYFATTRNAPSTDYTKLGKNVVEFFVSPGFHHLYTRVGNDVYSRISGLSKSGYYDSGSQKIGVLVELKPAEMQKLNDFIARAHANPREVIGPFNYGGGTPPNRSNCTSWITHTKVGERGQTLGAVCGTYPSGFPQGWVSSLINSRSDRVKAVVVHNPNGTFNENYRLDLR